MKAAVLQEKGLDDKLVYQSVSKPKIKTKQVLVKIFVTSVNQIDWKMGSGMLGNMKYPWIPGMDFSGEIVEVGTGVKGFKKGDFVVGTAKGGSYAEYIAADASKVVLKPENVSFVNGDAAAYVGQTAWQALLKYGKLQKGQRVLIHGGAGAVGAYAVQFARYKGAYVYATASGRDMEFVKGLGADVVIDYKNEDFSKIAKELDLVIDTVGGDTLKSSYKLIRSGGRVVTLVGATDGKLTDKYEIEGISMVVKPTAADLRKILKLMEEGKVKADVAAVQWLKNAHCGWEYVLNKDSSQKVHGKVIIQVQ